MLEKPKIVFVSGAHIDLKGVLEAPAVLGSSNPGHWEVIAGGSSLNAARVAKMAGVSCAICGLLGDDHHGQVVRDEMQRRAIVDLITTHKTLPSGTYTSIVEPNGNVVIALADLKLNDQVFADDIWQASASHILAAECLFMSANLAASELQKLTELVMQADERPLLAAATISPAKAPRIAAILPSLDILFTNVPEAQALLGRENHSSLQLAEQFMAMGVGSGTVSNGGNILTYWHAGKISQVEPVLISKIIDVTGAGDALVGATIAYFLNGNTFGDAVKLGMEASHMTLMSEKPVPEMIRQI